MTPKSFAEAKRASDADAYAKVDRRIAKQVETATANRKDFLSYILRQSETKGLSKPELQETAAIFIIAGSETTSVNP